MEQRENIILKTDDLTVARGVVHFVLLLCICNDEAKLAGLDEENASDRLTLVVDTLAFEVEPRDESVADPDGE